MTGLRAKMIVLFIAIAFITVIGFVVINIPDGEAIFKREGCTRCHFFKGIGRGIDLTGVSGRWSEERLRQQIRNPGQNNPNTGMPDFGHLSDREAAALVRYLSEKGQ